jgi:hypothetical protein
MDERYGINTSKRIMLKENRTIHNNYEPTFYLDLKNYSINICFLLMIILLIMDAVKGGY